MRIDDHEKTEACLEAVLHLMCGIRDKEPDSERLINEVSQVLRERLGSGWTYVSACQWLTGKRASAVVNSVAESRCIGSLTAAQARVVLVFAAQFCEKFDLSAGAAEALARLNVPGDPLRASEAAQGNGTGQR